MRLARRKQEGGSRREVVGRFAISQAGHGDLGPLRSRCRGIQCDAVARLELSRFDLREQIIGASEVRDLDCRLFGAELDNLFKRLVLGLGLVLPLPVRKAWARRFGWSLWASGHRR